MCVRVCVSLSVYSMYCWMSLVQPAPVYSGDRNTAIVQKALCMSVCMYVYLCRSVYMYENTVMQFTVVMVSDLPVDVLSNF